MKVEIEKIYSLSPIQEGMLFHSLINKDTFMYFEQATLGISGTLNVTILEKSFNLLIHRHGILRSIFIHDKFNLPQQVVLKKRKAGILYKDLSGLDEYNTEIKIESYLNEDREKCFNLSKDILIRISVLKLNEQSYKLILSFHHIILDGWSLGIIMNELLEIYSSFINDMEPKLIECTEYSNFINWIEKQNKETSKAFWQNYLKDYKGKATIPKFNLDKSSEFSLKEFNFSINEDYTTKLQEICTKNSVTINIIMQTIWGILLQKYNNTNDVVFGFVTSGRNANIKDIGKIVGVLINTIPIRINNSNCIDFSELLNKVQGEILNLNSYEYSSLAQIKSDAQIKDNFIDNLFVFENYYIDDNLKNFNSKNLGFDVNEFNMFEQTNYDFTIVISSDKRISVKLQYNNELYDETTIENISKHIKNIVTQITENPQIKLSDIDIIDKTEKEKILYEFNDTKTDYPKDSTIQELFEKQAEITPNNIAVVFEDKKLTYKELNEKANSLARTLRDNGIEADSIVGIMVEKSLEMIIGILGILKSGGCYLPIDASYPKERIEYMLQDSRTNVLLTNKNLLRDISFNGKVIDLFDEKSFSNDLSNLENINNFDSLAYIIYTSGTTGNPKGVMCEHKNVIRLVKNTNYIDFKDGDKIFQTGSMVFDASTFEFWGALLNGLELYLAKNETIILPELLHKFIIKNNITILFLTTELFNELCEYNASIFKNLRHLLVGGDILSPKYINKAKKECPTLEIKNIYGPTENTTFSTAYLIDKEYTSNIPIGKPISNSTAYIIDENCKLTPIGVCGELCVGGDGLAKGYLNRSELTKEKFIENPFELETKMYKTGDMARWLSNGNIEFLGRLDNQVKIRGFRIELGEIEYRLLQHKDIKDAVVAVKQNEKNEKYVCAYIISDKELSELNLKNYLKETLPHYMIPAYFVGLEKMPLTFNGKIDRMALPQPILNDFLKEYEAPRNEIEEKLVEIWSEVLGTEKVGINDNFFELGGHSLKATVLISKIHKELNKEVPLKELFKAQTIKELSEFIKNIKENPYSKINKVEESEFYKASSAQKRMYMIQQLDKNSVAYNIPLILELSGSIDKDKIEETFKKLTLRHESLRTYFGAFENEIIQKLDKSFDFRLIERKESGTIEDVINNFIKPFNLEKTPLFRVELVKVNDKTYLLIDMHHIISDGVSMNILLKEFTALYNGKSLKPLKLQYKDFASWQNDFLKSDEMKKQEEYWINKFSDEIPLLNLPYDYERPATQSFEGDSVDFEMNFKSTMELKKLAKKRSVTLHMVLLSAFNILLYKYSGQTDLIVGTPIAGRPHADLQNIMGIFVNTLALKNEINPGENFLEFLEKVKENSLAAYENQSYQFEVLVQNLNIKNDPSRNPLFDVMFNMVDTVSSDTSIELKGLSLNQYNSGVRVAKVDLILNVIEHNGKLKFNMDYCSKLFNRGTIVRLSNHFVKILDDIITNAKIQISNIDLLTDIEREKILYKFNDTKAEYPKNMTIHQLFEAQVEKTPDNIALSFEESTLTYMELNKKANSLANILRKKGVKRDSIVGIMTERSPEMIIGLLGILKAGGAYLPIDPKLPNDRIDYMIEDSKINIVVTSKELAKRLDFNGVILDITDENIFKGHNENLELINKYNDLAYIIYTSGTTGKPKGVMVEHNNVVRLMFNDRMPFKFNDKDVWTMFHSYCFDFSVWEMYGALLYGGKLVIVSEAITKNFEKYLTLLTKEKVTVLNQTPTAFYNLMNIELSSNKKDLTLKYIIFGGEALNPKILYECKQKYNKTKFINMYGITETTVHVTYKEIGDEEIRTGISNIGNSIPTLTTYVMDEKLMLQPIGVPGELCVGGDGVARGYLNREQLTQKKFVMNPYIKNERIYRSGDLVKRLENGELEYLGRIDNQVKIRGFRIELGEIENRLLQNEDIKEAAVTVIENKENEKYICGYVVSKKEVNELSLKSYLKESLPEYMIPSYFVQLDKMPITINGKLDRRALPKPNLAARLNEYEAPRNEIEEKLSNIWSEVLGIEKIGINDNFFELGGHSLKATVIISKMHKELNKEVQLKDLFRLPTIKELSEEVATMEKSLYSQIKKIKESDFYESSSVQKRMYMVYKFNKDTLAYNMPIIFELEGTVNKKRIESAFGGLVKRHEILRTYFDFVDDNIVQRIDNSYEFKLVYKKDDEEIEKIIDKFIRPFDLEKAPLFRIELVENTNKYYLLIDIHHVIFDGVSMNIVIKEFTALYNNEALEPVKLQYKDFTVWQNNFLKSEELKKQEEYWLNVFSDEISVLNLPYDFERTAIKGFEGDIVNFEVNENITKRLRQLAQKTSTTMNMILLSAFNILLSKYSGQEDIIIGMPIAGRPHSDLQNIVGMFVNTLVLRNKPKRNKKYLDFLNEIKENSLKAYENQSYQFEVLIEKLDIKRDSSRNPLFDVMFNMLDATTAEGLVLEDLNLNLYDNKNSISKFDLGLNALEKESTLKFSMEYCLKLFKKETIEKLVNRYMKILGIISKDAEIKISDIELLTETERDEILYEFNGNSVDYGKDVTIKELFELQVEKTPYEVAVVFGNRSLTYSELNSKANSLARTLRSKGVKPDSIVGILVDRSLEMIISIMAVLKAGGAYLPIDTNAPEDRIEYMLKDSATKILLTQNHLAYTKDFDGEILNLSEEKVFEFDASNLDEISTPSNLAYVIYTSGTTGNPKGVMIEQKSVSNLVRALEKEIYSLYDNKLRVALIAPYYFDASVKQIFSSVLNGHCLYIVPENTRKNGQELIKYYEDNKIDISDGTPIHLNMISTLLTKRNTLNLKHFIIGGEALGVNNVKHIYESLENVKITNVYGPTECTVDSTSYLIERNEINNLTNIPIGKPLNNYKLYILDKSNNVVPIGIVGELCISGDGLARGYLNKPDLTLEKFIDNPFDLGEKMYRTGDLAKWMPDGNIEFLGRLDNQVKISGFRIELSEIENSLLKHEDVTDGVVLVNENSEKEKYICAYVISDKELNDLNLKSYLKATLPRYMIPSYFIKLDKMPLNANGKLDRKSLPKPNLDSILVQYEAPRNDIEERLCKIWSQVLQFDKVGINDNFFDLGGNSIKIIKLINMINLEFETDISINDVYNLQSIKEISKIMIKDNASHGKTSNKQMLRLNKKAEKNIFAFPPIVGYGIVYKNLADSIKTYSFYAFDFIESSDRIERYVNLLTEIQGDEPYVLLGYSAGGNLAFEVAKALIEKGYTVSNIIMIDSFKKDINIENPVEVEQQVEYLLEGIKNDNIYGEYLAKESIEKNVHSKILAYSNYINVLVNSGKLNTDISLLISEENKNNIEMINKWSLMTDREFNTYQGEGKHIEVLDLKNNISKLVEIIKCL